MALWGNTDALAAAPKYIAPTVTVDGQTVAANTVTANQHGFITGDRVTYSNTANPIVGLTSGDIKFVIRVDANSFQVADSAVDAAGGTETTITAGGAGSATDTFQKTPENLFFIDYEESQQAENQARGLNGPGWWLYETYTDAYGNTRHKAECLVPMVIAAADAGDAGVTGDTAVEDATAVDRTITIDAQPVAASVTSPDPASFVVAASVDPATTITFQWQVSTDGGSNWANSTAAAGTTSSTLDVVSTDADYVDANQFRVVVSSDGATDVTSDAVLLTVA